MQLTAFLFGCFILHVIPNCYARKKTVTDVLNELLDGYDRRVRPHYDSGPVVVTVGFTLLSIDTINVIDMDFSMDMFLRQEWIDDRLDHQTNETMSLSNHVMDKIWLPDSYFVNAKDAKFHTVTTDNKMIMLLPNGRVQYNARVSVKLYCSMELRDFPMDTQYCPIVFESYGYSTNHITFEWEPGMRAIPDSLKILPQYRLNEVQLAQTFNVYIVGNWSGVKATFAFERTYSYFIYHVYAPSGIIVVISWIGFVLPRDKPPARITLGVTSVLTIVTVLNMMSNSVAKVNYVKRIDEYLIGCFLFVFCSLLEYSFVLLLAYRMKKYIAKRNIYQRNEITKDMINGDRELGLLPSKRSSSFKRGSVSIIRDSIRSVIYTEGFILAMDEYSLVLFPVGFIVFNIFYWGNTLKYF